MQYTLTVTNHGPSDAENVVLYDRLPPGIVVTDATAESAATAALARRAMRLDKLTCGLGDMLARGRRR